MGEGEGKKDVTDQIEDEEQLLGLKGDEPDKDQAQESKELGVLHFPFHLCARFLWRVNIFSSPYLVGLHLVNS